MVDPAQATARYALVCLPRIACRLNPAPLGGSATPSAGRQPSAHCCAVLEHRPPPELARVNPANVVTGDYTDANLYAVYLVHEAVVLKALLGEPRYLSIAPDAVRIDLEAAHTSPAVRETRAAARACTCSASNSPRTIFRPPGAAAAAAYDST